MGHLSLDYESCFADRETEAKRLRGFFKATQGLSTIPEVKILASLSPDRGLSSET
jgi:hypothetical protein